MTGSTVGDLAKSDAFRLTTDKPHFEVFGPIVVAHSVDVMDFFGGQQISPQDSFHHETMLEYVPVTGLARMPRAENPNVALVAEATPAFPSRMICAGQSASGFVRSMQSLDTTRFRAIVLPLFFLRTVQGHQRTALQACSNYRSSRRRSRSGCCPIDANARAVDPLSKSSLGSRNGRSAERTRRDARIVLHRQITPAGEPRAVATVPGHSCVNHTTHQIGLTP